MKVVILCGGRGTRIQEVSQLIPKPLVQIGERPILWHIMKIYSHFGFGEFVLCLGYKSWMIKEFFLNYEAVCSDIEIRVGTPSACRVLGNVRAEDWTVMLAETGEHATTGERLKRVEKYLADDDSFMLTYGDGVGNVNIPSLLKFHKSHGKLGTVTAVRPLARFGELTLEENKVTRFGEKQQVSSGPINGGFFVFQREFLSRLKETGEAMLERDPLINLANDGQLMCYEHNDWWMPMDTPREYEMLSKLWADGDAPWKVWSD
ncbi:glucose-1-phosphate cytidylyltransferase [Acidobacteria bacterium AH-259-L09]|nr:glucose-1-phosphate cytidylyltransferase [Acidobacteria bacterium AH-259-L09]